jgi:hypothetical protein
LWSVSAFRFVISRRTTVSSSLDSSLDATYFSGDKAPVWDLLMIVVASYLDSV